MVRMRTRSVQFSVSQGENPLPNDTLLICEADDPLSMEARKGELFIIVESQQELARHRQPLQLVLRTVRKFFYESASFSVQSALRRAIIAANQALYEYNMTQDQTKRVAFGMTCVVVKTQDVYVAQINPSQMYILGDGQLRAIPSSVLWRTIHYTPTPVNVSSMMGSTLSVEPEFFRAMWTPGETLMIVTSNLASVLDRDTVGQILRLVNPAKMIQALRDVCHTKGVGDAYGLAMVLDANVADEERAVSGGFSSITQQLVLAGDTTGLWFARTIKWLRGLLLGNDDSRFESSAKRWRSITRDEQQRMTRLPPDVPYVVDPMPNPVPLDLGESIESQAEALAVAKYGKRRGVPVPEKPLRVIDAVDVEVPSTPVDTDFARRNAGFRVQVTEPIRYGAFFSTLFQGLFVLRWLPKRNSDSRRMQSATRGEGLSYRKQRPPFPWAMLSLMIALVSILFFYGKNVATEHRLQRGENSILNAEQSIQAIYDSASETEATQRIEVSRSLLDNLQQSGIITATTENQQRFLAMVTKIEKAQSVVQRRSYLDNLTVVAQHPIKNGVFSTIVIPPPSDGYANVDSFNYVYLLDSKAGVVYQTPRDGGSPVPMLRPNDQIGEVTVDKVFDIAWRIDGVVALAQSSNNGPAVYLFRNGNDWNYSILAGSLEWQIGERHVRMQSYGGNLYVWGVTPANILRFLSTQIADFPTPWIQNDGGLGIDTAVDMGIDGRVYLLMPDGTIHVFQAVPDGERGFEKSITLKNITPSIQSVARLIVTGDGESGSFFILDSYASRIIQIEKRTGRFIQQIILPPDSPITLDNLTALAIDESQARPELYFANGGVVYKAPLPEPPLPFNQRVDNVVLPTTTVQTP
jgi:hypothetical protein